MQWHECLPHSLPPVLICRHAFCLRHLLVALDPWLGFVYRSACLTAPRTVSSLLSTMATLRNLHAQKKHRKPLSVSLSLSLSLSLCRCVLVDVSLNVLLALHCTVGLCWAGFPGAQLHGMCSSVMHMLSPHVHEIPHPFIPHLRYNDVRNPLPLPWPHDDNQAPSTE